QAGAAFAALPHRRRCFAAALPAPGREAAELAGAWLGVREEPAVAGGGCAGAPWPRCPVVVSGVGVTLSPLPGSAPPWLPQVGEDVPDARKCACASHVAKIAEFFQGVDVIVNASSVEDIDPGAIGQRLSNGLARVSSPVLHRLRLREDENTEPVGTTYQKTDATVEMKRLNREQFWEQAKKEEELRKEEERKKALDARLRFEQERMEQERLEQEERERRYREREEQIEEHRRKQQSMEAEEARQRLKEQSIFGEQQEEDDRQQLRKSESEVEEAAAIIAQRPDNPRDFFKQQERVASGSSDAVSPGSHRTGRLHCPFIKTADSGPPSSSSSSSSPPRTPFPYITCHRTPNLSSFFPCR
uniref:Drebrin 1 n=1 Tax=Athene cunicularia TaxID=194338 RepID=A0A663MMU8_ATHCN